MLHIDKAIDAEVVVARSNALSFNSQRQYDFMLLWQTVRTFEHRLLNVVRQADYTRYLCRR